MSMLRDAEMRVGQPGSSAGGRAHSGRGGDVGGGGDFLAHLHAEHPLHAGDGRLRIKVVRARNMPVEAGEAVEATPRGCGKEKRKKRSVKGGAAGEGRACRRRSRSSESDSAGKPALDQLEELGAPEHLGVLAGVHTEFVGLERVAARMADDDEPIDETVAYEAGVSSTKD